MTEPVGTTTGEGNVTGRFQEDRAIQVHGALGYSTDTPLERMLRHARSARLVDGADEVHLSQIAANVIAAVRGSQLGRGSAPRPTTRQLDTRRNAALGSARRTR
jgi:hypothetical protein